MDWQRPMPCNQGPSLVALQTAVRDWALAWTDLADLVDHRPAVAHRRQVEVLATVSLAVILANNARPELGKPREQVDQSRGRREVDAAVRMSGPVSRAGLGWCYSELATPAKEEVARPVLGNAKFAGMEKMGFGRVAGITECVGDRSKKAVPIHTLHTRNVLQADRLSVQRATKPGDVSVEEADLCLRVTRTGPRISLTWWSGE